MDVASPSYDRDPQAGLHPSASSSSNPNPISSIHMILQILDTPGIDGVHDQAVDAGGGAEGEELERQPAARTPVAAGSEAPDGADHGAHGAALVPSDDGA